MVALGRFSRDWFLRWRASCLSMMILALGRTASYYECGCKICIRGESNKSRRVNRDPSDHLRLSFSLDPSTCLASILTRSRSECWFKFFG